MLVGRCTYNKISDLVFLANLVNMLTESVVNTGRAWSIPVGDIGDVGTLAHQQIGKSRPHMKQLDTVLRLPQRKAEGMFLTRAKTMT